MTKKRVFIIGAGSIGKRHAKNFLDLGCIISIYDPNPDRLNEVKEELNKVEILLDLDEALKNNNFDGAVICSPTKYHVEQAIKLLNYNLYILMEKPLGMDLESSKLLSDYYLNKKTDSTILLGYTWRWWEALIKMRDLIINNEIGNIYHAEYFMSAHLADWHPWEPYQEFFMSSKELGGGALLDESHWIDQMLWFFGMPDKVIATIDKVSDLEITSDDSVEFLAYYNKGLKVFVHLDIYGRPHEKSIKIVGQKGKIEWNDLDNTVNLYKEKEEKRFFKYNNDRNDMFVNVAKEFIHFINNGEPLTCDLESGIDVMRIIEAARLSNKKMRFVQINEID